MSTGRRSAPGLGHERHRVRHQRQPPDAAARAAVERDLVEDYRRQLNAAGVAYGADECWRDYRIGSLWGVVITVIATVAAAQTERGDDMLTAMAQRHGRQALDLDALSLLALMR